MHNFKFGGKDLLGFCGRITQAPSHTVAERNCELVEIPGRSGNIYIDNKSYKNVDFDLSICFMPFLSDLTARQLAYAVINWLAPLTGYQIYEDTYNPGYYTKAVLKNIGEIKRELPTLLTATLSFSRLPYWYRTDGKNEIILPNDNSDKIINNPEPFDAPPIFIYRNQNASNASITLYINNVKTILHPNLNYTEQRLDGLNLQYKGIKTDGSEIFIGPELPPDLKPGENTISVKTISSSTEYFSIIPNWRRL